MASLMCFVNGFSSSVGVLVGVEGCKGANSRGEEGREMRSFEQGAAPFLRQTRYAHSVRSRCTEAVHSGTERALPSYLCQSPLPLPSGPLPYSFGFVSAIALCPLVRRGPGTGLSFVWFRGRAGVDGGMGPGNWEGQWDSCTRTSCGTREAHTCRLAGIAGPVGCENRRQAAAQAEEHVASAFAFSRVGPASSACWQGGGFGSGERAQD